MTHTFPAPPPAAATVGIADEGAAIDFDWVFGAAFSAGIAVAAAGDDAAVAGAGAAAFCAKLAAAKDRPAATSSTRIFDFIKFLEIEDAP